MNLDDVYSIRVPRPARRRVGRGYGSGLGKNSGRGSKGSGTRSGTVFRLRFEGGQMPLYRRLPKKGFSNHPFRLRFEGVNVRALEAAFPAGATVDLEALRAARLVPKSATLWKLLGDGEITKALKVRTDAASSSARAKVEKAGGAVEVVSGDARVRLEAGATRRTSAAARRGKQVEAYRAEGAKAPKPKKTGAKAGPAKKSAGKAPAPPKKDAAKDAAQGRNQG